MTVNQIPQGWARTSLRDLATVTQGQSPPGDTYNTEGVGLPFLQGSAEFGDLNPSPVKWCSAPIRVAQEGEILISIRAPVGPTNVADQQYCIGRGLAAIKTSPWIVSTFLLHQLRLNLATLVDQSTGSTFDAIGGDVLRKYDVLVAPHPEQQRIVDAVDSYLSRLDDVLLTLKLVEGKLRVYRTSVLNAAIKGHLVPTEASLAQAQSHEYESGDMLLQRILIERRASWEKAQLQKFKEKGILPKDNRWRAEYKEPIAPRSNELPPLPVGWCWATTDQLFSFVTSGSRGWAAYYSASGAPFIRIGNLDHERIELDLSNIQHVSPPRGAEGIRTKIRTGDILISITADVGMIGLVRDQFEEAYINQHVGLARPVDAVWAPYVAWFLAARDGGGKQLRGLQRGATKAGLGLNDIRSVNVPLPPLNEQRRIVDEIERQLSVTDTTASDVTTTSARTSRLKMAVLKWAFEGKLVDQNSSDEPADALLDRIRAEPSGPRLARIKRNRRQMGAT